MLGDGPISQDVEEEAVTPANDALSFLHPLPLLWRAGAAGV